MSDIDRKRAIEILKSERDNDIFAGCGGRKHIHEALSMAIASLETDEAYQLEYERTTKSNLGVDCISRADAKAKKIYSHERHEYVVPIAEIDWLPSVTPQEPQTFKWCETCKEYDQEKHCCHRWSKVIRNTVEEMKQEYIEREVLDKLRTELHATAEMHEDGGYYIRAEWINECFDKYKGESENP